MINFFRKIRKQLADDNKPLKYMRYAIGEILLVVIGILIALSINNWNEQEKSRSFELKMLSEIRKSLSRDITYFHMLTGRAIRIDTSTARIINLIIDDGNNDSLILRHLRNITHTYTFIYQDGAYEALKASGIENVSNDTLRNNLIDHYGLIMPRYVKLMNFYRKDSDLKLVEDLEWDLFSFKPDTSNGQPEISNLGLKPDVIGSDAFNRYIRIKRREAKWGLDWLENITSDTKALLKPLNDELNNSEL